MGVQYCEYIKKDGTKCKNIAQLGHKYCHVHLKTINQQDNNSSAPKSKTHKFDLFFGIFGIVVSIGVFIWVWQSLRVQLSYIEGYYFLGFNNFVIWLYRILLAFRYMSYLLFFIFIMGGVISSDESKERKFYRTAFAFLFFLFLLTGAENFVYYSIIGWHALSKSRIFEGFAVLFFFLSLITVWLATKSQDQRITKFLNFIFDLLITLAPLLFVFALSTGDSSFFNGTRIFWVDAGIVVLSLWLFSLGLDDLKGKPSLLSRFVIFYIGVVSGDVSLQVLQSKKAEALQMALQKFQHLSPMQQEQLREWIISNFKPSTMQKVWGTIKLVIATFVLTIIAQEPAVAFLKWFLKYFFDISY